MKNEAPQGQKPQNILEFFEQEAISSGAQPEKVQEWATLMRQALEKDRGEVPRVPLSEQVQMEVCFSVDDLLESTPSSEREIMDDFAQRLRNSLIIPERANVLAELIRNGEFLELSEDNYEAWEQQQRLLKTSTNKEMLKASEIVLDEKFGQAWREVLQDRLISFIRLLRENTNVHKSASDKFASGQESDQTRTQVKEYLQDNIKILYHGIMSHLTSFLSKGILAPKTEDDTVYGFQGIPLGQTSLTYDSKGALSWAHGGHALAIDCNKIDRHNIIITYPGGHPTYKGDISREAIVGVVAPAEDPCDIAVAIALYAIKNNDMDALVPAISKHVETDSKSIAKLKSIVEMHKTTPESWPPLTNDGLM